MIRPALLLVCLASAVSACGTPVDESLATASSESTGVPYETTTDESGFGPGSTSASPATSSGDDASDSTGSEASSSSSTSATEGSSSNESSSSVGAAESSTATTSSESGSHAASSESSSSGIVEESDDATESSSGGETGDDGLCESTIMRTHVGLVDARHGGDRFATRDEAGNLVVWDAASLEVLFEAADASHFAISSGVLIYDTFAHDAVYVVDATTGTPTGELPHQFASGIARDGGYVWTGSPTALRVYESDGSERWSVAGDFSDVAVLAMPDTLHAHASLESASEVLHYASADGTVDSDTFLGTFEGWFDDVPRYWTNQGMAYRVYDVDNSVLLLDLGYPSHGWDRWLGFGGWSVLDVLDPDTVVPIVGAGGSYRRDGAGILTRADDGSVTVTRLDTDPIDTQLVDPSCCVDEPEWSFAFSGGSWIIGGEHGRVHDHLDRAVTNGELLAIAGSIGGRIAISPDDGIVQIADVGDDCSFAPISSFPRAGRGMRMSGDGTRLLSIERWEEGLTSIRDGVRFYDLPAGTLLEGTQVSLTSETIVDIRVSDDASIWSRIWSNGPFSNYTGYLPLGAGGLLTDNGNIPTSIAPDSSHIVASDGSINQGATWSDSATYIYDPDDFVAVLDGVCHGFVDGDHVLVARYDDCGTDCLSLIGSELVAMDGTIVLATTLPDIRDLTRVADGEVLGVDHATGDTAIYDVYAGTMLWEAPPGAEVEVAGPDHVLVSTGARVALVRWR